jgi:regulatory protein
LRRKGVDEEIIAEALDPIDPEQERARAREITLSRYPQVIGLPFPTQARRLIGALTRRGYDPSVASAVVREVLATEGRDEKD